MAFAVVMLMGALYSLNAVVKKHPNVKAAITLSVKANIVLALDRNVYILPVNLVTRHPNKKTGSNVALNKNGKTYCS